MEWLLPTLCLASIPLLFYWLRRHSKSYALFLIASGPLSLSLPQLPFHLPLELFLVPLLAHSLTQSELRKVIFQPRISSLALLGMIAWMALSLLESESPGPAGIALIRQTSWILSLGLALPALCQQEKISPPNIALTLLCSLITIWIIGACTHPYFKNFTIPFFRNDNTSAVILVMILPILGGKAIKSWKKGESPIWLAASLICLSFLILSFSRGAWLGATVSGFMGLLFYTPRRWKWITALALLGLGGFFLQSNFTSQPNSTQQNIPTGNTFSNQERLLRWEIALRMTEESPILGKGFGSYPPTLRKYLRSQEELWQISYWFGFRGGAHSEYLNRLAESGIPGALLFVFVLFWPIFRIFSKKERDNEKWALAIGLCGFAIAALFNTFLEEAGVAMCFWLLYGLIQIRPSHSATET